jgi:hypothetical protein
MGPMRRGWFGNQARGGKLDPTLRRLVEDVSGALDRLQPPAVARGSGSVDATVSAVVLPHGAIPGCSLVLQVSEASSSVGCWWSRGSDPHTGPVTLELFAELPLGPDGAGGVLAWLERELRRPVVERVRSFGVVRRREWLVVLDDDLELPMHSEWLAGWRRQDEEAGWQDDEAGAGGAGRLPERWLLGVAVVAAVVAWALRGSWWWLGGVPTARVLAAAAFGALLVWFGVAGLDRPARVRAPLLAGLLLAALQPALVFLEGPEGALPSPDDPVSRALGSYLRGSWPELLNLAALACYLVAVLGLPGRGALARRWPWVLPVAVLVWLADLAVGLRWLAPIALPPQGRPTLTPHGVIRVGARELAVGMAIVLLLAVLDRRPGLTRRAFRAGAAGGVLLGLTWAVTVQIGLSRLAGMVSPQLAVAVLTAPFALAWFAGSGLLAVAAAEEPPAR